MESERRKEEETTKNTHHQREVVQLQRTVTTGETEERWKRGRNKPEGEAGMAALTNGRTGKISCVYRYQEISTDVVEHRRGKYSRIQDAEDPQLSLFDKPLPCCGCGIGWFSFLLGFVFPLMWYYATFLYFRNYYQRDPRERAGLAASAIAALVCTIAVTIAVLVVVL
ncbi:hypothetical protein F8388_023866 [Cannabis sativa]|uniref:Ribosomal protein L18ae family n=1 Tax=Cannabis sativa TaxID=3483 RepID=A0A7J6EU99_CANSA|nr:hypothetical protein F8388_023866 [Cannabis sativa]